LCRRKKEVPADKENDTDSIAASKAVPKDCLAKKDVLGILVSIA
jgi:hypothetical protein